MDGGAAVVAPVGEYEVRELCDAIDAVLVRAPAEGANGFLLDLSASSALPRRSTRDIRIVAGCLAQARGRFGSRLGMVAPTDLAFGMMRQGSVFIETQGVEAEVFRDYGSAMAWLAVGGRR